jgi:hypothetical protein
MKLEYVIDEHDNVLSYLLEVNPHGQRIAILENSHKFSA